MSIETLEIKEPGLLTTVQDLGRYGYQRFGVPVSGAMDTFSLKTGNLLLGNDEGAAGLEMTVLGPRVRFLAETWIAITGANLSPALDGEPIPRWTAVKVPADCDLSFQGASDGMRSYLAVAGGIDVPVIMGSRSTYVKAALGGLEGRALKAGDVLRVLEPGFEPVERGLPEHLSAPVYGHNHEIRVVLGPQDRAFTADGTKTFLGSVYTVSIQSDRMGYRLEGPAIESADGPDIVSDGIPFGAVQIPGDGRPIILLADRGTTGGYAKIATVVSSDLGRLSQAMPGDTITFKNVTVEESHRLLREQVEVLSSIHGKQPDLNDAGDESAALMDDGTVEVRTEEGDSIAFPKVTDGPGSGRGRQVRARVDGQDYEFEVE
ncbi:MAG: biotin-dependent carboxyltransferase family protein [SAR202 cluster bacterium]|jgi:biotin-dependent carboxylase-like uncharacterized protein|nr:biotin-dependent carboxyltransferase family protein [SAR202 cluster bacterium]